MRFTGRRGCIQYLLLDICLLIGAFGETGWRIKPLRKVTSGWGLVYTAVALAQHA